LFTQSVVGDVEYGPRNLKLPDDEVKERSNHVLEMMGIAHLKDRPPYRLSFGEKKKAALATALVLKPELLILDEPTANLDLATRRGLIRILKELHDAGTTIIVSTHDAEALPELADRIVVINEGTLLGDGTLSEILQNTSLLESAGLEPPTIVILFTELHRKGLVTHVPLTIEEGLKELSKST
jgi:cobalt/nickel transport system ATP-binding protein